MSTKRYSIKAMYGSPELAKEYIATIDCWCRNVLKARGFLPLVLILEQLGISPTIDDLNLYYSCPEEVEFIIENEELIIRGLESELFIY